MTQETVGEAAVPKGRPKGVEVNPYSEWKQSVPEFDNLIKIRKKGGKWKQKTLQNTAWGSSTLLNKVERDEKDNQNS